MSSQNLLRIAAFVTFLAPFLLGCASDEPPRRPQDVILGATDPNYPPFEMLDSLSGRVSGFDVDLAGLIVQANNWHFEDTVLSYEDLLPALKRGDIDLVVSALPMPESPVPDIMFSDPYYLAGRVLVLRTADSMISGLEDLPAGLLGIVAGTQVSRLERHVHNTRAFRREEIHQALEGLSEGTLAAMVLDYPLARAVLTTHTELRVCSASLGYEYYVFAMRSADSLRLRRLNDALAGLLGGYTYELLHERWFGYPPLNIAVPDSVSVKWPSR